MLDIPLSLEASGSLLVLAAGRPTKTYVTGLVLSKLPGGNNYRRNYVADGACQEELAAFYDDMIHEARTWSQMWHLAFEDVCKFQPSLF